MSTSMYECLPSSPCLYPLQGDQSIRTMSPPSPASVARVPSSTLPNSVEISMHYPIGGSTMYPPKSRVMGESVPHFPPRTDSSMSDPMSAYPPASTLMTGDARRASFSANPMAAGHGSTCTNVNPYHSTAGPVLRSVSSDGYSFPQFGGPGYGPGGSSLATHRHVHTHPHPNVHHRQDMSHMLGLSPWLPSGGPGLRKEPHATVQPHPFSRHASFNPGPLHSYSDHQLYTSESAGPGGHLTHSNSQPYAGVQGQIMETSLPNTPTNSGDGLDFTANDISAFLDKLGRTVNLSDNNNTLMSDKPAQAGSNPPPAGQFSVGMQMNGNQFNLNAGAGAPGGETAKQPLRRANSVASTETSNSGTTMLSNPPSATANMPPRTLSNTSVAISGSHSPMAFGSPLGGVGRTRSPARNTPSGGLQSLPALVVANPGNQFPPLDNGSDLILSYVMDSDDATFSTFRDFDPKDPSKGGDKPSDGVVDMEVDSGINLQYEAVNEGKTKRKRNGGTKGAGSNGTRTSRKRGQAAGAVEIHSPRNGQSGGAKAGDPATESEQPGVTNVIKSAPSKVVKRRRRPAHLLTRQHMCMHEGCGKKYEEWRSLQAHVLAIHGYRINRCDYLAQAEEMDSDSTHAESVLSPTSKVGK